MTRPTVIAATDLTPRSAYVAGRAALIARALDARLILAHVTERGEALVETAPTPQPKLVEGLAPRRPGRIGSLGRKLGLLPGDAERNPAQALTIEAESLASPDAPPVEIQVLIGAPGPALAELARESGAAVMVLGLHRERRVLDLLRLTTMERVVLDSPVPVLIAHRPPDDDYAKVLALTDFSPASAAALAMAGRLAPAARFHAIHALQLPLGARFATGDPAADEAITRAELLRTAFLARPGLPELAEPPEIVAGGVHEVLTYRRNELGADLVCIGSHSGREPSQLGNYARDLMRAPPTDLLVAKPA